MQAVRAELAALAPQGWTGYKQLHGSPTSPAMGVALPSSITFDGSYTKRRLTIPVTFWVAGLYDEANEAKLLDGAMAFAESLPPRGTAYSNARVIGISDFRELSFAETTGYACDVTLEVLVKSS